MHLALFTGGAVGVGGGLLGLGGAEFRLPLLVAAFRYDLPQAIAINVVVTLVTVVAGAAARLAVPGASLAALEPMAPMAASVAAGSVVGAFAGSTWVGRVSVRALQRAVRFLLVSIGALLVIEGLWSWPDSATATGGPGQVALGVIAGLAIGVVASLLGVAGGELIIPTLVYGFGAEIHVAGTLSLLISVPTLLVSLWRQRAALAGPGGLWPVVLPMWIGSVAGAAIGGALTRTFPADWL
ncbi:MAG: sulfite exporter TauE/SafE family protein, partial [Chloroflexi bacterium]|nr:sulfite exporter TauE/SafE family protein [Chloroflexota bacterium]